MKGRELTPIVAHCPQCGEPEIIVPRLVYRRGQKMLQIWIGSGGKSYLSSREDVEQGRWKCSSCHEVEKGANDAGSSLV